MHRSLKHSFLFAPLLIPLVVGAQSPPGSDLAYEFRITTVVAGKSSVTSGHALVRGSNIRFDLNGKSSLTQMNGIVLGDTVSIIARDTGNALTVDMIAHEKKQYFEFQPAAMMERVSETMDRMGPSARLDFGGTAIRLDSVGAGEMIAGHNTVHFRLVANLKVSMPALGNQPVGGEDLTADLYVAQDLGRFGAGALAMNAGMGILPRIPGMSADLTSRISEVSRRIQSGLVLKSATRASGSMMGTPIDRNEIVEVTRITLLTAPAGAFSVPAGYSKIVPPALAGATR